MGATVLARKIANFGVILALILFFVGGPLYRGTLNGQKAVLEVTNWGFALVPLFLVALARGSRLVRSTLWGQGILRLLRWQRRFPRDAGFWGWLIAAVLLLVMLRAILHRYWAVVTGWDLAIYSNACSHRLYSSLRDETTLMADHFEPVLALFTPLCEMFPPAVVLLTIQTLVWGLGAWGIKVLARLMGWSRDTSLLMVAAYLVFEGFRLVYFYDFHVLSLAGGITPWLLVALHRQKWAQVFLLAALFLGLKENAALTLLGLGLALPWLPLGNKNWSTRQRWVLAGGLTAAGALAFVLIMKVAFPYFRNGAESQYFLKYYGHLGLNTSAVIRTVLLHPWDTLVLLANTERLLYIFRVMAPFLFLVFLRPTYLIPIAPSLAINLLSSVPFMHSARFHYEADIYPWLFCAVAMVQRDQIFQRRWRSITAFLSAVVPGLRGVSFRGAWLLTLLTFFSGKSLAWFMAAYPVTEEHRIIRQVMDEYAATWGDSVRVAAFEPLTPNLSTVRNIFILDRWREADWVIIAYPDGKGSWKHTRETIEREIVPALDAGYERVYQHPVYSSLRIWRRRP